MFNETVVNFGQLTLGFVDYLIFILLLVVSLLIGIYFAFFSKQNNTNEYLFGGKTMNYLPIAMSILASHVSGMTLLGVPTEVYYYGSQYVAVIFTTLFTALITIFIFLPVFYKLQLPSTFRYLEIRFAKPVKLLCSGLYIISLLIYIPIVVYVPALAFSQVTKFSVHTITPIICIVCITYTTMGGLKAVVWTDTIQLSLTFGGLIAILAIGIKKVGGLSEVLRISDEGGRLIFFNTNPDPFQRSSFWAMSIGMTFHFVGHISINQGVIQRFLAVPTQRHAIISMVLMSGGMIFIKLSAVLIGLSIFSYYYDCDPLITNAIKQSDQIFPFYVMDITGNLSGLPGLFLAGLVSSALSTMSCCLNTLSGSIYEDFIDSWIPENENKEAKAANIMKILVIIIGLVSVGLVFVVENLGTIFEMGISMRAVVDGPVLGLFIIGMMIPWVKTNGAMIGTFTSLVLLSWLGGGTQWYKLQGKLKHNKLPVSVNGCSYPFNETIITNLFIDDNAPLIYHFSFLYYTLLGLIICIFTGIIASILLGETELNSIDPNHITPIMQRFLPKKKIYQEIPMRIIDDDKDSVDKSTKNKNVKLID